MQTHAIALESSSSGREYFSDGLIRWAMTESRTFDKVFRTLVRPTGNLYEFIDWTRIDEKDHHPGAQVPAEFEIGHLPLRRLQSCTFEVEVVTEHGRKIVRVISARTH